MLLRGKDDQEEAGKQQQECRTSCEQESKEVLKE